jgi:WD40 repeat protein
MASAALPPVLRSRHALARAGVDLLPRGATVPGSLPLTQDGATYTMAQEIEWLDDRHFAIGRWDGSLSVFAWNNTSGGPLMTTVASDAASEGVQMITRIGAARIVSSSGDAGLAVWETPGGDWHALVPTTYSYDPALGAANSGVLIELSSAVLLVVGHAGGFISRWSVAPSGALTQRGELDLRNPKPVNPYGLHNIRGLQPFAKRFAVSGSEDGFISVVDVEEWSIRSQTIFNASAQRGINSVALRASGDLLVANCAVGPADSNLWYFRLDDDLTPQPADHVNLRVDPSAPQVFNFSSIGAGRRRGRRSSPRPRRARSGWALSEMGNSTSWATSR